MFRAKFTADDVTTAAALATAAGDTTGAKCWGVMLPVATAVSAGGQVGLASAVELYRVAMLGASGPCAPIVLPILMKLGPALPFLSATLPTVSP